MTHTLGDLIDLSRNEPGLHRFLSLYFAGQMSLNMMLTEALYWYTQALITARKQLVDAEDRRPRIYYLEGTLVRTASGLATPAQPQGEGEDGSLG